MMAEWRLFVMMCVIPVFATVFACSSGDDDSNTTDPIELTAAFFAEGLTSTEGLVTNFTIDDCELIQNCYGNGPTTPYLLFNLPSINGDAATLPERTIGSIPRVPDDQRSSYYMNTKDALVIVGTTPPAAKYFGFTPYIYTRTDDAGDRIAIFASTSDTLNHLNISVENESPFNAPFAIVLSSDAQTMSKAHSALVASGLAATAINEIPLSRDFIRFGIEAESDTLLMLGRMALFDDEAAGQTYLDRLPLRFYRVSNATEGEGLNMPPRTERGDGNSEHTQYVDAVSILEAAIIDSLNQQPFENIEIQSAATIEALLNGDKCIQDVTLCRGDNGDTTYSAGPVVVGTTDSGALTVGPQLDLTLNDDDYFIVYGVNHQVTGKAVYANLGIYTADTRIGVQAVSDEEMRGSANAYVPMLDEKDALFAYEIRRDCTDRPYCLTLPTTFPGIAPDQGIFFIFRAYLNPGLTVSAAPSELVPERVILVRGTSRN